MGDLPERLISQMWQEQLQMTGLATEDADPITIIYPGRLNDRRGADLRDAVIATSGGLACGDIEFHTRSSHWWQHGHHLDPAYNRVVLQVVMWHDSGDARLENGGRAPTLCLSRHLEEQAGGVASSAHSGLPCCAGERDNPLNILEESGDARFQDKADAFRAELEDTAPGQCLYQGMMAALGYSKNQSPFRKLAARVPLAALESIARVAPSPAASLAGQQALLLGVAGLGESPSAPAADVPSMSRTEWELFKVRPSNHPALRIAAMTHLVQRYRQTGMLAALMDMVWQDRPRLEEGLIVAPDGHPSLLGRARAADIVINVLLPFACAWGGMSRRPGLAERAVERYRRYPRLAANAIERHMCRQLGLTARAVSSARRQQGLIHIYKTLCSQGRCHRCPLAGKAWKAGGPP
ncbi:MAG: DUF2851 family protein [Chloroflexi bacterium]|nr:DUF2851 family protein [Chloroflexota bacterium]